MKVWLFLVVLKVICAPGLGNWSKTGEGSFAGLLGEENTDCEATQDNCRCCLMMQKVDRKKGNLLQMVDGLKKKYDEAVQTHEDLTQKQSAFSATLFTHKENLQCFGPKADEATLIYKVVFFDLNNNYDSSDGIFTAPHNGYYIITVTVFHDAGSPKDDTSCVLVYHNDAVIAESDDLSSHDHEDSAMLTTARYLSASDRVYVNVKPGCVICVMDDHYNVFSVFLLYAD